MRKLPALYNLLILLFLWNVPFHATSAQSMDSSDVQAISIFEHFSDSVIVDFEFRTDMEALLMSPKKATYVPAELIVGDSVQRWNVRLRQRGKTRRRVCEFPPLKLKFYDTDLSVAGFLPFDDLKIVTHCFNGDQGEKNLLKEYAAYKIYNELCPASFRVQLIRVRYVDTSGVHQPRETLAFLIENEEELAARLNCNLKEQYGMTRDSMDEQQFMLLSVFQYFIGNTDWAVPIQHNLLLIDPVGEQKVYAIPYDFDYSGLVDAHYARPNPNLNQPQVTDRIFMSYCRDMMVLEQVLKRFREVKEPIMNVCDNLPLLEQLEKDKMKNYLEEFYKETSKASKFKRRVIERSDGFKHKI